MHDALYLGVKNELCALVLAEDAVELVNFVGSFVAEAALTGNGPELVLGIGLFLGRERFDS